MTDSVFNSGGADDHEARRGLAESYAADGVASIGAADAAIRTVIGLSYQQALQSYLGWLLILALSLVINLGMWMERFMIVVTSLHRDFLPSAWGMFYPTGWDWGMLAGSIGFFVLLFLLFVRFLPAISIFEMRELVHETGTTKA